MCLTVILEFQVSTPYVTVGTTTPSNTDSSHDNLHSWHWTSPLVESINKLGGNTIFCLNRKQSPNIFIASSSTKKSNTCIKTSSMLRRIINLEGTAIYTLHAWYGFIKKIFFIFKYLETDIVISHEDEWRSGDRDRIDRSQYQCKAIKVAYQNNPVPREAAGSVLESAQSVCVFLCQTHGHVASLGTCLHEILMRHIDIVSRYLAKMHLPA